MKDTLSRILAALAIVVALGTLGAAYAVWGMWGGHEDRIAALEAWQAEVIAENEKPEDTRELMPADYQGTLSAINAPASELVEYRNAEIGLAMKVPYSPAWGNRLYRVAPYQESSYVDSEGTMRTTVQFGQSFIFEGGGWARASTLLVGDALSADDEIANIQKVHEGFLEDRPIEQLNVNGKTVLVYYSGGLCSYVHVAVIGEKANYTLTPTCGDSDEIREEFLNIVRTMEFID
jgi:hypothetical protein